MKIHHLRNATFVIESGQNHILIDPMLGEKGKLPPFAYFRHRPERNPTVALPAHAPEILNKVTLCLITHSRTFGIRALQHSDHLDATGESFLRDRKIPTVTPEQDAAYLRKYGIHVKTGLKYWEPEPLPCGEITAIPARHGQGRIHHFMANGAGFYLRLPGEPSVYISGDTVYTEDVEQALSRLKPDIAVLAAGCASLDVGGPILMPLEEILTFVRKAPNKVIVNHLEALNHCPASRLQLKKILMDKGLLSKTFIPDDGETLTIEAE